MSTPRTPARMVMIIGTYPLLTTTFIDREIDAIRRAGTDVQVISVRRPSGLLSSDQRARMGEVDYLLPLGVATLVRAFARALRRPGRLAAIAWRLMVAPHGSMRARARTALHIATGVCVADRLRGRIDDAHLHAHFLDRATTIAMVVGALLDRPYSVTAHAADIYVAPTLLPEKIAGARVVATCTGFNADHLRDIAAAGTVRRIYHGLDANAYGPPALAAGPPRVLAVGQLKQKKGFVHLIEACALLRARGLDLTCEIVGEGPMRDELQRRIARADLTGVVSLTPAVPHEDLIARYREASVFVMPSVVTPDGDRDGIPNVLLEAMASSLPVVATTTSGIPEVVEHERTGLLVPPADPAALAAAIAAVLRDAETRSMYGKAGREVIETRFDPDVNARELLEVIGS